MSAGLYDDLVAQPVAPGNLAQANQANPYADLAEPVPQMKPQAPPATAADRLQAAEGGILKGGAYLAGLVPDTIANVVNLGRAAGGYVASKVNGGHIPDWADPAQGGAWAPPMEANPVGGALVKALDKSPVTTTQPNRPDDPASRYLNTGASVVPGVLAGGGGSIPAIARGVATAVPPALAGQYVAEAKPFESDAANTAASALTQALGSAVMPRIPGAPVASKANQAVEAGQDAGYSFPPGATNPTPFNRMVSGVAGKTSIDQHAAVKNQPVTNEQGRAAMGVPKGDGSAISDVEVAQAKAAAAPGYDAMRNAGTITAPANMTQQLATALNQQSGAGRMAPSLRNSALNRLTQEISKNKTFDASDGMDTIAELRDRASAAYRNGDASAGRAYKAVSKVIEDAMEQGAGAGIVQGFRDSRQRFAAIATVEDNRNPTTGNLQAQKLAAALKGGDYIGPAGSPLRVAGEAAGQAPKAFAEPTSTPGSSHLGMWGSIIGALELGNHLPGMGEHGGLMAAGIPLAYQGARAGARSYILGPGQKGAVQYQPGAIDPRLVMGGITSMPGYAVQPQ